MSVDFLEFYRGRRVLVTGHTGFTGAWLCHILKGLGAEVTGYALQPPTQPSLFELARVGEGMHSVTRDVRDADALYAAFCEARPEVIFHLAAQPIVREGYRDPLTTFDTNVMGTLNVLECIRRTASVRSALIVTTDKVYENAASHALCESDPLGGPDPYSASKACAELAVQSYRESFFADTDVALSTARAGNVIGGGDFAPNRILPDCVRAVLEKKAVLLRNPEAVRPYQHVLEPLLAYLMIAARQYGDRALMGCYNIGPDEADCVTTRELAQLFAKHVQGLGLGVQPEAGPREAAELRLDCSKLKNTFGWHAKWDVSTAVAQVAEWTRAYMAGEDVRRVMDAQIAQFINA